MMNSSTWNSFSYISYDSEISFEMPQVLESNSSVVIALVLTGLLLLLGGVVGIRYLKRRALRNAQRNHQSNIPMPGSVFVVSESVRPVNNQIDLIYVPSFRRVPNTNIQSSQYVQRNNEILLEHTIVIDSFPNHRANIRPNNMFMQNNERPSQLYPLDMGTTNDPPKSDTQNGPQEDLHPDVRCVICWEQEANVIFAPCAHKCCCTKDGWYIMQNNKTCPMCRNTIEGVINATLKSSNES